MSKTLRITDLFPKTRARTVLLELLQLSRKLQKANIDAVLCGGWIPFLKELSRIAQTSHPMSLDIDLILRDQARDYENIDLVTDLIREDLQYSRNRNKHFLYEKMVDGIPVELELLADYIGSEEEFVKVFQGKTKRLELCRIDGGESLGSHVETIAISAAEIAGGEPVNIRIPDPAGFLMLKTKVTHFREQAKDPYDIFHYCRYSEDPEVIRETLASCIDEPAIAQTIKDLKRLFEFSDSKWVEMVLDFMQIETPLERDRQALFVTQSIARIVRGLGFEKDH